MSIKSILSQVDEIKESQENLYKYFHKHPELSMHETNTTKTIEKILKENNFSVQLIGGGVVGVLKNGEGQTVLLRADIDALPVKEESGLEYASTLETKDEFGQTLPVMHACGHDFHITSALGVSKLLSLNLDQWSGTFVVLFQPGEETSQGAKSMLNDGLFNKIPKPDVALAQHVLTDPVSGKVGIKSGPFLSTAASIKIVIKGKSAHGSMPNLSIDPVVIGSSIVSKLQTIVSREIDPFKFGVVTVGSFHAGLKANIIPGDATLLLNIRAYDEDVKQHLINSIKRISINEALAGGCIEEPEIEIYDNYPLTSNNEELVSKIKASFIKNLGNERVVDYEPKTASEDFSYIPDSIGIPYCYWGFGGFAQGQEIYPNHNPKFAPTLEPTLKTGTEAALVASLTFLSTSDN